MSGEGGTMRRECECETCHPARLEAYLGWITIAVFVAAFDIIAKFVGGITLSEAFRRIRSHPARHTLLALVWALLTWHLFERGHAKDKLKKSVPNAD